MEDEKKKAQNEVVVEETATEVSNDAAPEVEKEMAKEKMPREILYERIRAARPEGKYDDDEEEYYRAASSMMDDWEKKGKAYDDLTEQMANRFSEDPDDAEAWMKYMGGMPMRDAIAAVRGEEGLIAPKEGEEGYDNFMKVTGERKERLKQSEDFIKELMANAQASDAAFEKFAKDNNMDEKQLEEFKSYVMEDYDKLLRGIFTPESLTRYLKMRNYDKDIEGAMEQGRVEGRNEKIEAKKKEMAGSGLPNANAGGNAEKEIEEKPVNATAEWLGRFNHR